MSDVTDEMVDAAILSEVNRQRASYGIAPHLRPSHVLEGERQRIEESVRVILAAVAPLIAAAEREACAQVVQTEMTTFTDPQYAGGPIGAFAELFACKQILNAIRARTGDAI